MNKLDLLIRQKRPETTEKILIRLISYYVQALLWKHTIAKFSL